MECKYCQMELADGIRHAWLKKRAPGNNSPTRGCCPGAPNGVAPALVLIDFDFDPAVLGSTLCSLVVSDRFRFAEPLTGDPAAVHTLLHYVVPNRHPTPIR